MTYQFELTAEDYGAMNAAGFAWGPVVQHFVPHAACEALVAWLFASRVFDASQATAAWVALVVFAAGLVWHAYRWRRASVSRVVRMYDDPATRAILGSHTLELAETG